MFTKTEYPTNQTVAFTGYRKAKIISSRPYDSTLLLKIEESVNECVTKLYGRGFREFVSGGASGFDLIVASALITLRESTLPDIKIIAAIPHEGQSKNFDLAEQHEYQRLICSADEIHYISKVYYDGVYLDRNKYMLTRSSLLVCYYDGKRGGTMYTVNRALRMGLEIINLCEGEKKW